jgi:glycyl-tRNA synthetase alpha subunit
MDITNVIAGLAFIASIYAVFIQKKELANQREELRKSAEANEKSQYALNQQTELFALTSLLEVEMHLHEFNNKKTINVTEQTKYAAQNLEEIRSLKNKISALLKHQKNV